MKSVRVATTSIALAAILIPAAASGKDVTERVINACRGDYKRFCQAYSINTPELNNCMERAGKRLTPRCLDALIDDGLVPRKYLKK